MLNFDYFPMLNVMLLSFSALVTLFLLLGVFIAKIRLHAYTKSFCCFLVAHIILQLAEAGMYYWGKQPENIWLFGFCCFLTYSMEILIMPLFTKCLVDSCRELQEISFIPEVIAWISSGILILCSLLSLSNGMLFQITEQGECVTGLYNGLYNALYALCLVQNIALVLYYRKLLLKRTFVSLLCYLILPFPIIYFVHSSWYPTPVHLMMTLLLIVIFINFYSSMQNKLAQADKELAESRIAIMTSQIQPHFLYNSLNTIYHLCDIDVKLAQQAVGNFSEYLQCVLGSIKRSVPITFKEELRNVRAYLELEKLRFDDDLRIVYDISATDFLLPALSVQMLVENAVKHGICLKEDGGTLTLRTCETADSYEIIIMDDGVGFALEQINNDGKLHVGLQNSRQRLKTMVNGLLKIESKPGVGTKATIIIPKEKKK